MPATPAELVQRARAIAPAIAARAAETAQMRQPHADSIRALIDAELIQMLVPARWGGSEAPLSTMMDVVEAISTACPSTGWIAAFYISHNIYVAKFPAAAQEELFGPRGFVMMPAASAADMEARKVDGGWEVSGRAAWGSGVMHADWVQMSGRTEHGGNRTFLIPASEVEVLDTWHYAGMAGTGSNDYVARKVFVPDHRSLSGAEFNAGATDGARLHANPLYSIPFLLSAYCTILPVLTGTLAGGLRAYEDIVARRVRNFSGVVVKDQQHAHVQLGEFQIATRAASDLARAVYARIEAGLPALAFSVEDRLLAKAETAFTSRLCRDTINAMMAASGASSFHVAQPMQRIWRDLNTVASHAFWDWDVSREQLGRHHFGLPPTNPLV